MGARLGNEIQLKRKRRILENSIPVEVRRWEEAKYPYPGCEADHCLLVAEFELRQIGDMGDGMSRLASRLGREWKIMDRTSVDEGL
jgi:hypothetical protein